MDKELKEITEEELKDLSIEELADLKVETEDMIEDLDEIVSSCENILNA